MKNVIILRGNIEKKTNKTDEIIKNLTDFKNLMKNLTNYAKDYKFFLQNVSNNIQRVKQVTNYFQYFFCIEIRKNCKNRGKFFSAS